MLNTTLLAVVRQDDRIAAQATAYCGQEHTLDRVDVRASAGDLNRFAGVNVSCTERYRLNTAQWNTAVSV